MNKSLIAIMLIAMVSSTYAFQIDLETCFTAAALFTHDVKAVVEQAKAEKISISQFLNATYAAAEAFNPLLHGCGVDLAFIDKVDSFTFNNTSSCFVNIDEVSKLTTEIATMVKEKDLEKDFIPMLQAAMSLFKKVKETKVNCEFVPKQTSLLLAASGFENLNINIFKCVAEAQKDVTAVKQLVADFAALQNNTIPIEDFFEEGVNTYNNIIVTLTDCGVNFVTLPPVNNVSELKTCVKDVHQIGTLAIQALEEIKTFKITEFIHTIQAVGKEFTDARENCIIKKVATKFLQINA